MDSFLRYSSMLFYISSQIIPFSFGTYQIFRNPCRRDTLFKLENRHSKLSSDKLLSLVVPALAHCARGCLRDSNCLSLNYQPFVSSQVNCELLAGNKTTTGAVIQSSTGWIHYSPVIQEVGSNFSMTFTTQSPAKLKQYCNKSRTSKKVFKIVADTNNYMSCDHKEQL